MENILKDGFTLLYSKNEKLLPNLEFKEQTGDLKRTLESTVDQLVEVDPIVPQIIPNNSDIKDTSSKNVTIKEDETTIGERIISDNQIEIDDENPDGTPSGNNISNESKINWRLDDFLGENEYLDDDESDNNDEKKSAEEKFANNVCETLFSEFNNFNLQTINHTSEVLSTRLGNIYHELRYNVTPIVEKLVKEINLEVNNLSNNSSTALLLAKNETIEKQFKSINWNELSSLGSIDDIIMKSRQVGNLRSNDILNFQAVRISSNKWMQKIDEPNIPENIGNAIIRKVEDVTNNEEAGIDNVSDKNMIENEVTPIEMEGDDFMNTENTDKQAFSHDDELCEKSYEYFQNYVQAKTYGESVALEGFLNKFKTNLKTFFSSVEKKINFIKNFDIKKLSNIDIKSIDSKVYCINKNDIYKDIKLFTNVANIYNKQLISKYNEFLITENVSLLKSLNDSVSKLNNQFSVDVSDYDNFFKTYNFNDRKDEYTISETNWDLKELQTICINMSEMMQLMIPKFSEMLQHDKVIETDDENKKIIRYVALFIYYFYFAYNNLLNSIINTAFVIFSKLKSVIGNESYYRMDDFLGENEYLDDDDDIKIDEDIKAEEQILINGKHLNINELDISALENLDNTVLEGWINKVSEFINSTKKRITKLLNTINWDKINKNSINQLKDYTVTCYDFDYIQKFLKYYYSDTDEFESILKNLRNLRDEDDDEYFKYIDFIKEKYDKKIMNIGLPKSFFKMDKSNVIKYNLRKQIFKNSKYNSQNIKMQLQQMLDIFLELDNYSVRADTIIRNSSNANFLMRLVVWCLIVGSITSYNQPLGLVSSFVTFFIRHIFYGMSKEKYNALEELTELLMKYSQNGMRIIKNHLEFIEKICKKFESIVNEGFENKTNVTKEVYNIISSQPHYYRFVNSMKNAISSYNAGKQIPGLLNIVKEYPKILDTFKTAYLNISEEDQMKLRNNAQAVDNILQCIGLYLLTCRKYFSENNVLILNDSYLNNDVVDQYHKDGGSKHDIDLHIHYNYTLPNLPIPNMGIRGSEIIKHKQRIATEHIKRVDAIKKNSINEYNKILNLAYNRVLDKYLKNTPEYMIPAGMTLRNFINSKYGLIRSTSTYLNDSRYSLDGCVWRFLLKLWYNNKPIYHEMYTKLEKQYMEVFDESDENISENDIATADAKVISTMVVDFLFNYCIKK